MKPKTPESVLRVRIRVAETPPGVMFAVQRGKMDLLEPSSVDSGGVHFQFSLRIGPPLPDGSLNFLGEFAQGPPAERFVYVNSGIRAGQTQSCWDRRAKLKLAGIPRQLVERATDRKDCAVEARILGIMRDGGPVCASVPPSTVEWRLVPDVA
jgi:Family of unknown function (DUF5990)